MKIAMVSPEASPYSKTGGLADVAGALPAVLERRGHRVLLFTPLYRGIREKDPLITDTGIRVDIPLGGERIRGELWRKGDALFIGHDPFFGREEYYGKGPRDYDDNARRFAFFSLAVLEALKVLGERPDVIHCHDWQTGLIPVYLREGRRPWGGRRGPATLFTIHNLAYQGLFPLETMKELGLPSYLFQMKGVEFYGKVSFIKGGLVYADLLSTVSRRYSREIQGEALGCGLDGLLRERGEDLFGIMNGIDQEIWDPERDPFIEATYSREALEGKKRCKAALRKRLGLPDPGDIPLVGMISRFDPQKGFDLIEDAEKALMALPIQMVFLGKGAETIQAFLEGLARRYPDRVALATGYDEALAHQIEAGADLFLMPSRYEPCGLNHLYSLRYGTLPVVRGTGGLDDAIRGYSTAKGEGNGFKFRAYTAAAMVKALRHGVDLYRSDRAAWHRLQQTAMAGDYSWGVAAKRYEQIYLRAVAKARKGGGTAPWRTL